MQVNTEHHGRCLKPWTKRKKTGTQLERDQAMLNLILILKTNYQEENWLLKISKKTSLHVRHTNKRIRTKSLNMIKRQKTPVSVICLVCLICPKRSEGRKWRKVLKRLKTMANVWHHKVTILPMHLNKRTFIEIVLEQYNKRNCKASHSRLLNQRIIDRPLM